MIRVSCRWGILPITWDAGLDVRTALGGDCIYTFLNAHKCVNNVYICFYLFLSTNTVSRKPY